MKFVVKLTRFWFLLAVALLFGYSAIYNHEPMTLSFPPWVQPLSLPIYVGLAAAFLCGSAVTLLYFGSELLRKSLKIRQLQKRLRSLEATSTTLQKQYPSKPVLPAADTPKVDIP